MVYRAEIDGLRAIAVLAVILFHCGIATVPGGFVGVDVFFVISGFLVSQIIWKQQLNGSFKFSDFIRKRVLRLLPAALFLYLVVTAVALIIFLPLDLRKYGQSLVASCLGLANHYFAADSDYFSESSLNKPLLHMWSLSVEEQFYAVMPLLLIFIRKMRANIVLSLSLVAVVSFTISVIMVSKAPTNAYYILPSRFWELALGAIIGISGVSLKSQRFQYIAFCSGLLAIALAVLFYDENMLFPGFAALLPCLGTALILIIPTSFSGFRLLKKPLLTLVGKSSYSSYLWHWPIVVFYGYAFDHDKPLIVVIALVLVSLIMGYLSWRFIENPFRKATKLSGITGVYTLAATTMVLLCIVGGLSHVSNGFAARFPEQVKRYDEARNLVWSKRSDFHNIDPVLLQESGFPILNEGGSDKKVLVWGDSHASSMMPVIQKQFEKTGIKVYAVSMSAKLPFINTYRLAHKQRDNSYSQLFVQEVKRLKITDVILVASWSHYLESEFDTGLLHLHGDLLNNTNQLSVFKRGLQDTVSFLEDQEVTLWVLSEVPRHKSSIPSLFARAEYLPIDPNLKIIRRKDYLRSVAIYLDAFQVAPKLHFFDYSSEFFDEGGRAKTFHDGELIYYDSNHLNTIGAEMLSPKMSKLARKILTR